MKQNNEILREIFHIHIPKTGGSWLNGVLTNVIPRYFPIRNSGHMPIGTEIAGLRSWSPPAHAVINCHGNLNPRLNPSYGLPKFPGRFEHAIKVSIGRNPFDLLASYYFHDVDKGASPVSGCLGAGLPNGWDHINVIHGIKSFDGFIKRYCDPDFRWWHTFRQQNLFFQMFDSNGKCGVDIIMRNEYLYECTDLFLYEFGYIQKGALEPHRRHKSNSSALKKDKDYRSFYTDELRELVEKKCEDELTAFKYDFDGPTTTDGFVEPGELPILPPAGSI